MRLLPHSRHLSAAAFPALSPLITTITPQSLTLTNARANFHTSTPLQRPGSGKADRNPKIGITLEQLRMASRGQGRRLPICHAEQEKVMNSLEAAKYEVCV